MTNDNGNKAGIVPELHYIYFIREVNSHYVKIGYANDPVKRVGELQIGNPHDLIIAHAIQVADAATAKRIEHVFHVRFQSALVRGEWYVLSERDLEDVKLMVEVAHESAKAERKLWHRRVQTMWQNWKIGQWLPDDIMDTERKVG